MVKIQQQAQTHLSSRSDVSQTQNNPPVKSPESAIAQGIGYHMGGLTIKAAAVGFVSGALAAAIEKHSAPIIFMGGIAGGAITGGAVAICTRGIITAADAAADLAIFTVKLPFLATYKAGSFVCSSVQSAYQSVMGTQDAETPALMPA